LLLAHPTWLNGHETLTIFAAAFVAISAILASAVAILRGAGQNLTGQAIDLALRPALVVLVVFALHMSVGLTVGMALGAQIGTVVACLFLTSVLLWHTAGGRSQPPSGFHVERWSATSATYLANSLLGALNASYPMIVAGLFATGPDLGVLRVAIASAVLLNLPSQIANIATIPLVARHYAAGDILGLARTLSHTTLACFALTAAGWLFLLLFGKPLIVLLFGTEYAAAYAPLLMLGAGQLVIAAFGIAGAYLNLTNREGLVTRAFLISVPLGIAVSLGLAPSLGIIGASAGTVVMAAAWHFYVFAIHRRQVDAPLSLFAALKHVRSEEQ
jgi:O-antigen/teichoic acid export membrane protein